MGELHRFDLQPLIDKYDLKIYFETGTGKAISLRHALKYSFKKYFSADVDPELIESAKSLKEQHEELVLIRGFSKDAIREIVPTLEATQPVLFFLDAHFPGADFHKISYEESIRRFAGDAFPLEEEVKLITSLRDTSRDVFIIDDLVLYEDGQYEYLETCLPWQYGWLQKEMGLETNSDFLYDTFSTTHSFKKELKDQGYLVIIPDRDEK